jgi:hypothetical protein
MTAGTVEDDREPPSFCNEDLSAGISAHAIKRSRYTCTDRVLVTATHLRHDGGRLIRSADNGSSWIKRGRITDIDNEPGVLRSAFPI